MKALFIECAYLIARNNRFISYHIYLLQKCHVRINAPSFFSGVIGSTFTLLAYLQSESGKTVAG